MSMFLPNYVQGPTKTPLPYGLMSVAQLVPTGEDRRWQMGVQFQPNPCEAAGSTLDPCPVEGAGFTKPNTSDGLVTRGAQTFTVYSKLECAPPGFWNRPGIDPESLVMAHLTDGEAREVERVFWTGATSAPASGAVYPHLAANAEVIDSGSVHPVVLQTAATTITGTLDIVEAIGELESRMAACYGAVGVIHAPREAFAHMAANHLIYTRGGTAYTLADTPIAFGAGYTGTGPDGSAPPAGSVWLYATGSVMLRRSEASPVNNPVEGLNRAINDVTMIAERKYNIAWDCCHFAVLASMGGVITGTAGSAT